jgi:hypothetical protein
VMFVASHKHEHLKGLIGQGGSLHLQDVLVMAEGACVMVATVTSSSSFIQATTCNSMASLRTLTQSRSSSRGPNSFLSLQAAPSNAGLYLQLHGHLTSLTQSRSSSRGPNSFLIPWNSAITIGKILLTNFLLYCLGFYACFLPITL